jgi:PAS domain S-box-containing protein
MVAYLQPLRELGDFAAGVVEGDTVAFISWYRDGELFTANPPLKELTGYSDEEMGRMRWPDDFCTPGMCDQVYRAMDLLDAGEKAYHSEEMLVRKDGSQVPVDLFIHKYQRAGRAEVIYFSFIIDMTARKKAEKELEAARAQAEMYIDLMGHDISNMNQIGIGYLEIALEKLEDKCTLDEHDRDILGKALSALKNSSMLIDNVRKLQQVSSGEVHLQKMDLGAVLSEAVARYSKIPGRDVTINYRPATGRFVMANELLKDVFSNLLGNAIKHSPEEKPLVINIEVTNAREHDIDYYRTVIEDNGPGICGDNKEKLFQRFGGWKTGNR